MIDDNELEQMKQLFRENNMETLDAKLQTIYTRREHLVFRASDTEKDRDFIKYIVDHARGQCLTIQFNPYFDCFILESPLRCKMSNCT